jgi:hypothetical protein
MENVVKNENENGLVRVEDDRRTVEEGGVSDQNRQMNIFA